MKADILSNLENPAQLEKLYRSDKGTFKQAFRAIYPELQDTSLVRFWNERLNFAREEISWGTCKELVFVIIASLAAGTLAKLPEILQLNEEFYYTRNVGFIVFPILSAYFAWKNKLSAAKIAAIAVAILAAVIFMNVFPDNNKSDTLTLSCIHVLLFLWSVLGFAFVNDTKNNVPRRLGFLSYNGDLIVMTTLIVISGAILSGITIGLFSLIGINIERFYFENVVVFVLPAAPIVGTYLTQRNPYLVGKVSPVIAKIFSPLVLAMLVIYLVAIIYSGKDPYNDREFLIVFNALLIGVMAIIFFSVAESSKAEKNISEVWIIFLLSAVTVVVNSIALSAIIFRITEYGITPNRAAVLGSNGLILINLLLITIQLLKVL